MRNGGTISLIYNGCPGSIAIPWTRKGEHGA
jgi:hypothetical protein